MIASKHRRFDPRRHNCKYRLHPRRLQQKARVYLSINKSIRGQIVRQSLWLVVLIKGPRLDFV